VHPQLRKWLAQPVLVRLSQPVHTAVAGEYGVAAGGLQRGARRAARILPWALVVIGAALSVIAAIVIERDLGDAKGGLAVEVGAALWFAGAVTLGARTGATLFRFIALVCLALVGMVLIAAAVLLEWSGAALDLALEYGVAAVGVAVVDVLLLGLLHPTLTQIGEAEDRVLTLSLRPAWPFVTLSGGGRGSD
jgi:hypothetical protein